MASATIVIPIVIVMPATVVAVGMVAVIARFARMGQQFRYTTGVVRVVMGE